MSPASIPMPPRELRELIGPADPKAFENPSGEPIYAAYGIPLDAYDTVFDFGCGCGRLARKLLQQNPRPRRYVGIDVHRGMIDWCNEHLSPIDPNFQFLHHDVYAPSYAPRNSLRLAAPFPVGDGESSLVIAHSVFTHLFRRQTTYYLREIARILKPQGVAFTSWFFFDRDSFPFFRDGPFCLFAGEADPTSAVIYDRTWFIDTVRLIGLGVRSTVLPTVSGHQWTVFLVRRTSDTVDQFPLGQEGAERVCGATLRPIGAPAVPPEVTENGKVGSPDSRPLPEWPQSPPLFGALAELDSMKRSWTWRIGRVMTEPVRAFRKLLLRLRTPGDHGGETARD